ncbi:MAG: DUF1501 domain-containing protein [Verrucomicrobia bacterium]|nr:DUF1501 domain-containing protein [Verrucomicrobiota bacterium]
MLTCGNHRSPAAGAAHRTARTGLRRHLCFQFTPAGSATCSDHSGLHWHPSERSSATGASASTEKVEGLSQPGQANPCLAGGAHEDRKDRCDPASGRSTSIRRSRLSIPRKKRLFATNTSDVHTYDLNATILNLLGLDHERLTFRYQGRDFRLTDVHGGLVPGILA